MKTYDWIVVGGGITGAALSYELAKIGFSVLLLEKDVKPQNSTRYSYGGLAYWSGTTKLTRQLCAEGISRHRILSEELETDTEFRELDLILTIDTSEDPEKVATAYSQFAIPPKLLNSQEACEVEPLLNPDSISGALTVKHGHINPELTTQGYTQAMIRLGGKIQIAEVLGFLQEKQQIFGIKTANETYQSANVVVCAGGVSRSLLKAAEINIRLFFTHAELIEIAPVDLRLRTLVMPAQLKRFQLEAEASKSEVEHLWEQPETEIVPYILDPGAIQFQDGRIIIGQISRTLSDRHARINANTSETALRTQVGKILPKLANLPGKWHHCLVGFSHNRLPVIGAIPNFTGIHIFSGFSNPLVLIPPLAKRFAKAQIGEDSIINQLKLS
ncbi:FAD-binding oxidoreductase [Phormidium sp. LEGE 05292]|uniref:NAD(P)/FAD-dependent oxidoreductase n=1 Tax=[Phormidium] sp. LEGE 05292 TaxID=767427 RepID=UPI0018822303|nr:FAD-binding oxidoreductase [Phormidium sp. LEGE 05292]MBE9227495.1 FAD-binding oxidoreductase [Phormidium sp. LEGE 05292]